MFILLVTWIIVGQPASSYQIVFTTEAACVRARDAVTADAAKIARDDAQRAAALFPGHRVIPATPPTVSAVCVAK